MEKHVRFIAGYKILKEYRLIIELRLGMVNLECMKALKLLQTEDKEFDSTFDVLSDTSEMQINLIITELKDYADFFKKASVKKESAKKIAGIVITPHQIVHGTALRRYLQEANPMQFEFFPDVQTAINWLDKPLNEKEVLDIIEEIRKNPQFSCNK